MVNNNLVLTAVHWSQIHEPQHTANWNSGKCCDTCHHVQLSGWV